MKNTNQHFRFIDGKTLLIQLIMKTIVFLSIICVTIFSNSIIQAQNPLYDHKVERTIKDFYTEYCNIWNNTPTSVPANALNNKIDSLAKKYCTKQLRNKAKSMFVNGQELYTNDYGIVVESLKTLVIKKDPLKENYYNVYFTTTNTDASGKAVKQQVILHIYVVKDKDSYKINEIN